MTVWQSHHWQHCALQRARFRKSRKSGRDPLVAVERGIRGGAVVSMEHGKGTSSRYLFSSSNGPNSDVHARPLLWCALPTPTSHAAQRAHCEIPFLVRIIPPYSIQLRPFPLSFSSDSTPRLISQFVPACPRLRHQFYFKSLIFVPNQPSTWSRSAAPARGRTKRRRKKSSRLYLRTALTKSRKREFERFPPPFERASHRWSHQYCCASQHCCTFLGASILTDLANSNPKVKVATAKTTKKLKPRSPLMKMTRMPKRKQLVGHIPTTSNKLMHLYGASPVNRFRDTY